MKRGATYVQHGSAAYYALQHLCDHRGLLPRAEVLSALGGGAYGDEAFKSLKARGFIRTDLVQITKDGRNAARRASLRHARAHQNKDR